MKRLLCLANSRKVNGRCVAGVEVIDHRFSGWIRPISDRENHEVAKQERQYPDGSDPRVMDVIDVPLIRASPSDYQTENWLLEPKKCWHWVARAKWEHLSALASAEPLWLDPTYTYYGKNDRVRLGLARRFTSSLSLVHVQTLTLSVFENRRVQGRFSHAGNQYRLWITDPGYERTFRAKPAGDYTIGECFLTISLSEPFNGYCYKIIAAVIEKGGAR